MVVRRHQRCLALSRVLRYFPNCAGAARAKPERDALFNPIGDESASVLHLPILCTR